MLKIKVAGYFPSITYSIIYQSDVTNHGGGRVALRNVEVMVVGDVVKVFFAEGVCVGRCRCVKYKNGSRNSIETVGAPL